MGGARGRCPGAECAERAPQFGAAEDPGETVSARGTSKVRSPHPAARPPNAVLVSPFGKCCMLSAPVGQFANTWSELGRDT